MFIALQSDICCDRSRGGPHSKLERNLTDAMSSLNPTCARHRLTAMEALRRLYGQRQDFDAFWHRVQQSVTRAAQARPEGLRRLDAARTDDPHWFNRPGRPLYCTYIDRLSGTLNAAKRYVPYLRELGVGLFHPLPLLKPREGDSDGGFAVADYKAVDPRLGTFGDLVSLADELRGNDISLVLDVVCNHTAREHPWARGWIAGDPAFADFYIRLDSEAEVMVWSASLNEVFPDTAPGNFSFDAEAGGWVWTTFYPFQWDLNYANPQVFLAMLDVLLTLANAGVEGFRLDSAAYLWKIKGSTCRNLPQAHDVLLALRSCLSEAAPGVFLLAEAIEGLEDVLGYFGDMQANAECDLAYANTPMTALWGALAEGRAAVMEEALRHAAQKPDHGTWLNYARCHDDIIWQALAGWLPQERLKQWSDFYAGDGGYSDGMAFQAPAGLAASTCGMAASLCGRGCDDMWLDRLKLIYSVVYALDGVPMIYMGDELGLGNDRSFLSDPERSGEMRWLHRPAMDWAAADERDEPDSMFAHLKTLSAALSEIAGWSSASPALAVEDAEPAVLRIQRRLPKMTFHCLANLSGDTLALAGAQHGDDLLSKRRVCSLRPYQVAWICHATDEA